MIRLAAIAALAWAVPAAAQVVTTPAQLTAALKAAKGGETIRLAPGEWPMIELTGAAFRTPVTVTNADPAHPALIRRIQGVGTKNVTLLNLEVSRIRKPTEPEWTKMIEFADGSDVYFVGGSVHGSLDGNPLNDMHGIYVRRMLRFRVTGTKFQELNVALTCDDCTALQVQSADFSLLALDAMDIPGARGANILLNTFHDFRPGPGAHPDGIQCWTRAKPSGCKDVTIFRNTFTGSPGYEFQGVFFGDEDGTGGYDRIKIDSNTFTCTMWHAVNLYGLGVGQVITNNRIVAGPNYRPWIRTAGPALVLGNSAPTYLVQDAAVVPVGNAVAGLFTR